MGGRLALISEVLQGPHQPFAEECGPLAVHSHAAGQRILGRHEPSSQCQIDSREPFGKGGRNESTPGSTRSVAWRILTAVVDEGRPGVVRRTLGHHQRGRYGGLLFRSSFDLRSLLGQLGSHVEILPAKPST